MDRRLCVILGCLAIVSLIQASSNGAALRHDKCYLPLAEGTCSDQILRWFYSNETGLCQTFLWSGCGGNENNFNSSMYCLHACNGTTGELHAYSISKATSDIKGNPPAAAGGNPLNVPIGATGQGPKSAVAEPKPSNNPSAASTDNSAKALP